MPLNRLLLRKGLVPLVSKSTVRPAATTIPCLRQGAAASAPASTSTSSRQAHTGARSAARPRLQQRSWGALNTTLAPQQQRRTIFIQTENTPNPDSLKFLPNQKVIPDSIKTPFIEYMNARSTIAPPYPSPLAAQLMNIEGVTSVFYGTDFITVTKSADANWAHIRPEVFALITETITSGQTIVNVVERNEGEESTQESDEKDSLAYDENDSEVVGMIKELLETRIRPAIQEDGGDIEFRGFEDGIVKLKLRGACRTCDSSTVTLKNGIEGMLMHYIEEVQGVEQVLDPEEDIALQEFQKFEEKLRKQKGEVPPTTVGKDSLDSVPG
ncbi:hypothetical protein GE21DRAFT_3243 [Neurospora crassa]|uniref:HIRA-interacting protein 5 n=2 Tax=Neurospora crassa TaxID=5141 RepID=Q1K5Q0_NEUCR|nr:HIRA-interacting protein 5 [Neurospora crassa OR74A]EAA27966.1 HIRA-interacting protein 5 [Neurospora crassa OR74A]KHE83599.1 hypothetical protein GE21DRAFT_3243 [Neurospora crassa]CAD21196.1 conserved hypothetical protein [Neurospora crassa]|eukprot:XP_957202.1 HIRA-interacting protein 5 [Neurospora crassa OR74A]